MTLFNCPLCGFPPTYVYSEYMDWNCSNKRCKAPTCVTVEQWNQWVKSTILQGKKTNQMTLYNHFAICLDASGSMQYITQATIKAYNAQVAAIRDGAFKSNQQSDVTLVTFGEQSQVRLKYAGAHVDTLRPLDHTQYRPDGSTPMLAAIKTAVDELTRFDGGGNHSFLVIVITDGQENCSYGVTSEQIRKLLAEKRGTDRWTFVFSGPQGSRHYFERHLGGDAGNISEWEATEEGAQFLTKDLVAGTQSYYGARSAGKSSVTRFFTTDASNITQQDLKSLPTVRCKSWIIEHECSISSFVESKGIPYSPGNGYYQLTKPEKVQAYKQLMIREKGKKTFYGGNVRGLLNLPAYEVKVEPGNHANYDIFVQSSSSNRKLVRGSTLLYMA